MKICLRVLTIAMCLIFIGTASGQKSDASPTISPAAQVLGITTAIQHPPAVNYGTEMNAVNSLTGKVHGIVLYYADWSTMYSPFLQDQWVRQMPSSDLPIPMIAWEPTSGRASLGCDQDYSGGVPPDKIIQGACDRYITSYAKALKATGWRFLLKFAHEMNGSQRPWWPGNYGETPGTFVNMWRHVRDIFTAQQVTNVEWVWAPIYQSAPNTASNDVHLFYPGDGYVDWVGPMGYNYYNQLIGSPQAWASFHTIFDATLKDFACRYPKPQIIHEFASVEDSSGANSKAAWIMDAYQQAQNYPFLRSLVWYNDQDAINPNADFRVTTHTGSANPPPPTNVNPLPTGSGAWTNAYKNAIAPSVFTNVLPSLATATPPETYCNGDGVTTSFNIPTSVLTTPGSSVTLPLTAWLYTQRLSLSLTTPISITGSINPNTLPPPWGKATVQLNVDSSTALGTYQVVLDTGVSDLPIQVRVVSTIYFLDLPLMVR